jgi:dTDP-4-dehydrorhamnose 3,5-epimerase
MNPTSLPDATEERDSRYVDRMQSVPTPLPGVFVLEPTVFGDERGFFFESWNQRAFDDVVGTPVRFVQDNHSRSARGVLRGLHYQLPEPQGKLVRCTAGVVWDVAVDLRQSSSTFLEWFGVELSAENKHQLWIPEGFGHGFVAQTDGAELLYKTTSFYNGAHDRAIRWDDPKIGIDWPLTAEPTLSAKDARAASVGEAELFE